MFGDQITDENLNQTDRPYPGLHVVKAYHMAKLEVMMHKMDRFILSKYNMISALV